MFQKFLSYARARSSICDMHFVTVASSEVAIFFGILLGNYTESYLVFTAITLSLLVSYARAKADAAGIRMQGIGIGERAERLLVIAIIGMIGFMEIAVIIVIIIAGITLAQRILVLAKNR